MGVLFAALSFALFACVDVAVKWLAGSYSVTQIVMLNAAFGAIPILAIGLYEGGIQALRTRRPFLTILRGLSAVATATLGFNAFTLMPVADAYAIMFCAPLILTALSVPLLKEPVGWRRWAAVCVGMAGVLIMLRPGSGVASLGAFMSLGAAVGIACSGIIMRILGRTESSHATAFLTNLVTFTVAGAATGSDFIVPPWPDLAIFAVVGFMAGGGLICIVAAYRNALAAVVAPFQYTQIVWGGLLGYLMWADVPGWSVIAGGTVVIASGLYTTYREAVVTRRRLRRADPPSSPG